MTTSKHNSDPTRRLHLTAHGAIAVGATALTAAVALGVGVAHTFDSISHRNKVIREIEHSGPNAVADYKAGKFSPADVTIITSQESGTPFAIAKAIVGDESDPRQLSDIIASEAPNGVYQGEELVVPKDELPHTN